MVLTLVGDVERPQCLMGILIQRGSQGVRRIVCDVLPWTPETEKSLGFTELLNDLPGSITFSGHDEFTFESCPSFRKLARRPSGATRPASQRLRSQLRQDRLHARSSNRTWRRGGQGRTTSVHLLLG